MFAEKITNPSRTSNERRINNNINSLPFVPSIDSVQALSRRKTPKVFFSNL